MKNHRGIFNMKLKKILETEDKELEVKKEATTASAIGGYPSAHVGGEPYTRQNRTKAKGMGEIKGYKTYTKSRLNYLKRNNANKQKPAGYEKVDEEKRSKDTEKLSNKFENKQLKLIDILKESVAQDMARLLQNRVSTREVPDVVRGILMLMSIPIKSNLCPQCHLSGSSKPAPVNLKFGSSSFHSPSSGAKDCFLSNGLFMSNFGLSEGGLPRFLIISLSVGILAKLSPYDLIKISYSGFDFSISFARFTASLY